MFNLKNHPRTLAGKLSLAIFILMIAISASSGLLFFTFERSLTMRNLDRHARFMDELIQKSLFYDMLENRREDIAQSLENLGDSPDIETVHVYNTRGRILFSSNPSDVGKVHDDIDAIKVVADGGEALPIIVGHYTGDQILNYYSAINSAPECSTAACHFHNPEQNVLGVLYTSYNVSEIAKTTRRLLLGAFLVGALMVVMISLFLFYIIYKFVTRPVSMIEEGMTWLSDGNFQHPIELNTRDEMGRLAQNFNAMAHDIQKYKNRLENWAEELQAEVEKKTAEIKETQEQLVNAEKLASLGRMSAGVAHELNNPLTGVVTFAHLMLDRTPPENTMDREDLELIIEQADRCTKIIKGLLSFSRKGSSEKSSVNLNELLENAVSMIRNQSAFHNVKLEMDLKDGLSKLTLDANQIQQVFLNLITNAADAMNGNGKITIKTGRVVIDGEEFVEAAFSDTGPGISPENLNKILEPFFTTKSVGKGTGLGLPVSYGIVKRHGGDLLIHSKVGKGATVTVRLPVKHVESGAESEGEHVEFQ